MEFDFTAAIVGFWVGVLFTGLYVTWTRRKV